MLQTDPQQRPETRPDVETPFSLAPAIFTPFSGLPPGDQPVLDAKEKLQKIVENLPAQQDAVRRNMLSLAQQHADKLVARARKELDALERGSEDTLIFEEEGETPEENAKKELLKKEVAETMQRLKIPARKDAKSEEYELKPGSLEVKTPSAPISGDGDVEMGGMNNGPSKRRTATVIREELSRNLKDLVDQSAKEMEAYDTHSLGVYNHYKQALERRNSKTAAPLSAPKSILKRTGGDYSPVSPMDGRTISFAQPSVVQPPRTYESIGDVARRGSK